MPSYKISSVLQLTDNLTLNGYYEFEHRVNRNPETGTYFSPVEVLTENSECFVLAPGVNGGPRTCFKVRDNKVQDSGEYGVNLQYTIEPLNLETSSWCTSTVPTARWRVLYGTFGGIEPEVFNKYIQALGPGRCQRRRRRRGAGYSRVMSKPLASPCARRCSTSASAWISCTGRMPV